MPSLEAQRQTQAHRCCCCCCWQPSRDARECGRCCCHCRIDCRCRRCRRYRAGCWWRCPPAGSTLAAGCPPGSLPLQTPPPTCAAGCSLQQDGGAPGGRGGEQRRRQAGGGARGAGGRPGATHREWGPVGARPGRPASCSLRSAPAVSGGNCRAAAGVRVAPSARSLERTLAIYRQHSSALAQPDIAHAGLDLWARLQRCL